MSDIRKSWYLLRLRRNAWLKPAQLLEIQERKLRRLVRHAYYNVEYYHDKFNSVGLKPDDIKKVEDLKRLPLTTKEDIRKNFPLKITARNVDLAKCTTYSTSGSTGMPLQVFVDPEGNDYRAAVFGRPFFECGLRIRDKMMLVGDARRFPKELSWFQKLGFLNRKYFSASEPAELHLHRLLVYNPDAIYAYSSYIFTLAQAIHEHPRLRFRPRMLFTTAEMISDEQRQFIESAFNTRTFDLYGCVETERLGWECREHCGYHLDIDSDVIEFVRDGDVVSPGEEGKLVVTCLYNYAMPLIRYDIGDIGVALSDSCSCGRGLPLMGKIIGRQNDLVVCPDGRRVISPIFINIMRRISGIAQYRIVQDDIKSLTVSIVKNEKFSTATHELVIEEIRAVVGDKMSIKVLVVDQIEKERSGKIRAVISRVDHAL